ncbi:HAMP domain-containing sensor histidine kinase [Erysipelothrix aquatica]|uniref:HAMP domain-containing sensor histidine kinase n=1 Tax=Erysipelothrix aquatica TaxID=2683714 RepID=UPI00135C4864|nr:HAMP domain-containing sensor histidine kinase [Erysipelothrix aquatica]
MFSLVLSLGLASFMYAAGTHLVNSYYLSENAIASRKKSYEDSFITFIQENKVASTDASQISRWIKQNTDVYLFLIDSDGYIFYESGYWSDMAPVYVEGSIVVDENHEGFELTPDEGSQEILYETRNVEFTDGTFTLYISESSELFWVKIVNYVSIGFGVLLLMLLQILFTNKVIKKVNRLAHEVNQIGTGNINFPITKEGCNELAKLAQNIDSMRDSLLEQMKKEQEVVNRNYELVGSLSHDVRTPLTSLIGYMELLDEDFKMTDAQKRELISRSKEKTFQLKLITDKMFQYFFDFNEGYLDTNIQDFNLSILLQQLIYERVFDLSNGGFVVKIDLEETEGTLKVDLQYLHRLFDNIFSNISRYGMKNDVTIKGFKRDKGYVIEFENLKNLSNISLKGTNVGLKTCASIMNQIGGMFEVHQTARKFIVIVTMPLEEN